MFENFWLAFIPIFVAVDALGTLPIFASLTHEAKRKNVRKIIVQSMITAVCVAVGFIFLGQAIFGFLGITMADFMVAGGAVLFCIAIIDLVSPEKKRFLPAKDFGVVPLGTPLLVGPAVLATSLIIIQQYGMFVALVAVVSNVLLAGLIFYSSAILTRMLGEAGAKAISKVTSLFLAAIAVMIARKGIVLFLGQ